ncbi:hypothetical protein FRC02_011970 [Tulasnella sp. 418]|nr:hypothetical protein FRC02_011970 [Tulasnella sp. 418]
MYVSKQRYPIRTHPSPKEILSPIELESMPVTPINMVRPLPLEPVDSPSSPHYPLDGVPTPFTHANPPIPTSPCFSAISVRPSGTAGSCTAVDDGSYSDTPKSSSWASNGVGFHSEERIPVLPEAFNKWPSSSSSPPKERERPRSPKLYSPPSIAREPPKLYIALPPKAPQRPSSPKPCIVDRPIPPIPPPKQDSVITPRALTPEYAAPAAVYTYSMYPPSIPTRFGVHRVRSTYGYPWEPAPSRV